MRHLKQQVEDAEIHYLTKKTYAPLLEANPYIDRIHAFDGDMRSCLRTLKNEEIDYIIDLHHNARSARIKWGLKRMDFTVHKLNWKKWLYVNFKTDRLPERHMVDRNLDTIQSFISERDSRGLDYFIPQEEEISPESLPPPYRKGFIGLAIGAQHATKMLPAESLVELCGKLRHPVIILGGPGDEATGEAVLSAWPGKHLLNGCGKYSIHQSASLVKQSRVLITHDTGLMHIGAAYRKPVISVWGNTVPRFGMYPYRPDPRSVQYEVQGLKCRPCSKIGHDRCPKKHFRCMLDQDLDGMAEAAHRLFGDL
jgi:heptosyltransferase-2